MPAGQYEFVAHTTELQYPGLTDAAGNPLDDTDVPGEGTKDFIINFDVQPAAGVHHRAWRSRARYSANGSTVIGGEQSYFELPPAGGTQHARQRVRASHGRRHRLLEPAALYGAIYYANDVQLIGSANSAGAPSDGDFGNLGEGGLGSTGTGFTILSDTRSRSTTTTSTTGPRRRSPPAGRATRLVLQLDPGDTLSADDYRVYIPNQIEPAATSTPRIFDIYGNQLDGENLGNQTSQTSPISAIPTRR